MLPFLFLKPALINGSLATSAGAIDNFPVDVTWSYATVKAPAAGGAILTKHFS